MRQTRTMVGQNGLQKIAGNVACLCQGKDYLEVRHIAISRALRKLENQLAACVDPDEEEDLSELVENLYAIGSDIESYRSHLETEIDRVRRGLDTLKVLRGKPGRRAFAAYIAEDTDLSVQDLAHARSYYDQVIESVKKLKDESPK